MDFTICCVTNRPTYFIFLMHQISKLTIKKTHWNAIILLHNFDTVPSVPSNKIKLISINDDNDKKYTIGSLRNILLSHIQQTSQYVCWVDDDDIQFPERIHLQKKKLEDNNKNITSCTKCLFTRISDPSTITRGNHLYSLNGFTEGTLFHRNIKGLFKFKDTKSEEGTHLSERPDFIESDRVIIAIDHELNTIKRELPDKNITAEITPIFDLLTLSVLEQKFLRIKVANMIVNSTGGTCTSYLIEQLNRCGVRTTYNPTYKHRVEPPQLNIDGAIHIFTHPLLSIYSHYRRTDKKCSTWAEDHWKRIKGTYFKSYKEQIDIFEKQIENETYDWKKAVEMDNTKTLLTFDNWSSAKSQIPYPIMFVPGVNLAVMNETINKFVNKKVIIEFDEKRFNKNNDEAFAVPASVKDWFDKAYEDMLSIAKNRNFLLKL